MRPCDCIDQREVETKLNESGVRFNECFIEVRPNHVIIENGPGRLRLPMRQFQHMAEWYLRDQAVLTDRYDRHDGVIEVDARGREAWIRRPRNEDP